jgi:hypothetical protein
MLVGWNIIVLGKYREVGRTLGSKRVPKRSRSRLCVKWEDMKARDGA